MREMQHQTILSSSSSRSLRGGDEHDDWEWPTCQAEYTFLEQVGKGATAEVWIAYCDSLDALAAVKKFYLLRKPPTPEKTPNEVPLPGHDAFGTAGCLDDRDLYTAKVLRHDTRCSCLAGPSSTRGCRDAPA